MSVLNSGIAIHVPSSSMIKSVWLLRSCWTNYPRRRSCFTHLLLSTYILLFHFLSFRFVSFFSFIALFLVMA